MNNLQRACSCGSKQNPHTCFGLKPALPNNLQRAKEEAMKLAQGDDGILSIGKYDHEIIDEIVTSTYLQAEIAAIEMCRAMYSPDDTARDWDDKMANKLQSLKQTN